MTNFINNYTPGLWGTSPQIGNSFTGSLPGKQFSSLPYSVLQPSPESFLNPGINQPPVNTAPGGGGVSPDRVPIATQQDAIALARQQRVRDGSAYRYGLAGLPRPIEMFSQSTAQSMQGQPAAGLEYSTQPGTGSYPSQDAVSAYIESLGGTSTGNGSGGTTGDQPQVSIDNTLYSRSVRPTSLTSPVQPGQNTSEPAPTYDGQQSSYDLQRIREALTPTGTYEMPRPTYR